MLREHLSCVRGNCALNDYMLREQQHRAWDNWEGDCGEGDCGEGDCGEGDCGEVDCGEGDCGEGEVMTKSKHPTRHHYNLREHTPFFNLHAEIQLLQEIS